MHIPSILFIITINCCCSPLIPHVVHPQYLDGPGIPGIGCWRNFFFGFFFRGNSLFRIVYLVTLVVSMISFRRISPSLPEISTDCALCVRLMVLFSSEAEKDELLARLQDSSANSISPSVPLIFIGDLLSAKRTRAINMARIRIVLFIYPKRSDSLPAYIRFAAW